MIKSVIIIRDLIIVKKIWHLEKSGGLGELTSKAKFKSRNDFNVENGIGAFGFCDSYSQIIHERKEAIM